jgi:hypothetical protein
MKKRFKKYNIHYNGKFIEEISGISKKSVVDYVKSRIINEIDEWHGLRITRFSIDKIVKIQR